MTMYNFICASMNGDLHSIKRYLGENYDVEASEELEFNSIWFYSLHEYVTESKHKEFQKEHTLNNIRISATPLLAAVLYGKHHMVDYLLGDDVNANPNKNYGLVLTFCYSQDTIVLSKISLLAIALILGYPKVVKSLIRKLNETQLDKLVASSFYSQIKIAGTITSSHTHYVCNDGGIDYSSSMPLTEKRALFLDIKVGHFVVDAAYCEGHSWFYENRLLARILATVKANNNEQDFIKWLINTIIPAAICTRDVNALNYVLSLLPTTVEKSQFNHRTYAWALFHPSTRFDPNIEKLVPLLISIGFDLKIVDDSGNGLLHFAVDMVTKYPKTMRSIQYLLAAGLDPNLLNSDLDTPLHKSLANPPSNKEVNIALIMAGAKLDIPNKRGKKPSDLCKSNYLRKELTALGCKVTYDTSTRLISVVVAQEVKTPKRGLFWLSSCLRCSDDVSIPVANIVMEQPVVKAPEKLELTQI